MRSIDIFATALTNLRRQKLRSSLTVFAVVIGALSVTVMLTLVTSAKDFASSQLLANGQDQQVLVTSQKDVRYYDALSGAGANQDGSGSGVVLDEAMAAKIRAVPGVTATVGVVYPGVFDQIQLGGKTARADRISTRSYQVSNAVTHEMVAGTWVNEANATQTVAVSTGLANELGFGANASALVGKELTLTTRGWYQGEGSVAAEQANQNPNGQDMGGKSGGQGQATTLKATITGVTTDGDNVLFPSWRWAEGLMQRSENGQMVNTIARFGFGTIIAVTASPGDVDSVAKEIAKLGPGTATAKQALTEQQQVFNVIGYVLGAIGAIALLVASIGVINTMVMSILERTREIGVLRALGASRATVRRLFTVEAAMLGFLGGLLGVAIGYGAAAAVNPIINNQLSTHGFSMRNIITVPTALAVAVVVATTVIGVLAGLYPAARAARMDPVEALRAE